MQGPGFSEVQRWPLRVRAVGPVAGGAIAWRYRGTVMLTAVVKASFAMVADAPMTPVAPGELHVRDEHVDGNVRRSLRAASDMAPMRRKADVLVTGHVLASGGASLRLAVSGRQVLLDKTIQVVDGNASGGAPVSVALEYEEAAGGSTRDDNPAGSASPRLLDIANRLRPACFAPIAQSWPVRHRLLGGLDRRALDGAYLDLPPSFDWSFYQSAPMDQQIDHLHGDEWILLGGLHPTHPVLRTRLPWVRGVGELYGLPGVVKRAIKMSLDTVHIDLDQQRCSVVLRGAVQVPDGVALAGLELAVGVESSGQPAAHYVGGYPRVDSPPPASTVAVRGTAGREPLIKGYEETELTAEMRVNEVFPATKDGSPFAIAKPGTSPQPAGDIAGAPWAKTPAKPVPPVRRDLRGTFELPDAVRAAMLALSPAAPARAPEPPSVAAAAFVAPAAVAPPPVAAAPAPPNVAPPPFVTPPSPPPAEVVAAPEEEPAPRTAPSEPPRAEAAPEKKKDKEVFTTASPDRKPLRAAPPAPAPPRRDSPAAEAVRGSVYGRFGGPRR